MYLGEANKQQTVTKVLLRVLGLLKHSTDTKTAIECQCDKTEQRYTRNKHWVVGEQYQGADCFTNYI